MTQLQKVIKYCAVAFAILLIVGIISGIISAAAGITVFFGGKNTVGETKTYAVDGSVSDLKIDIAAASLEIREGDGFSVESNLKNLKVTPRDGKLVIEEKSKLVNVSQGDGVLILTIPKGHLFRQVDISTGAGKVTVDALSADTLTLELGAGEVSIDRLTAAKEAEIDGGAGKLTIADGALANLAFDMGVGETKLTSRLSGNCDLNMGVGKTELNLIGGKTDYALTLDKGVGSITVDGESVDGGARLGNGKTSIDIDGGIGAINIRFIAQ